MLTSDDTSTMTAEEIVELRGETIFRGRPRGVWNPSDGGGKGLLRDAYASPLNRHEIAADVREIGHGNSRVIEAIQAARRKKCLCRAGMAVRMRAAIGSMLGS